MRQRSRHQEFALSLEQTAILSLLDRIEWLERRVDQLEAAADLSPPSPPPVVKP
jgi:hypothetical protein